MLVTESQSAAIAWTIGGVIMAIGALIAWRMLRRGLPGSGLVLVVLLILGYASTDFTQAKGSSVLLMRGDDRSYVRSDLRLYGSKTYTYGSGRTEPMRWLRARQIIINDTPRPLQLHAVVYGWGPTAPPLQEIAPFQSKEIDEKVMHFGPGDPPPAQVETSAYGVLRYWLTW